MGVSTNSLPTPIPKTNSLPTPIPKERCVDAFSKHLLENIFGYGEYRKLWDAFKLYSMDDGAFMNS
jgi:hypothetical protein